MEVGKPKQSEFGGEGAQSRNSGGRGSTSLASVGRAWIYDSTGDNK